MRFIDAPTMALAIGIAAGATCADAVGSMLRDECGTDSGAFMDDCPAATGRG